MSQTIPSNYRPTLQAALDRIDCNCPPPCNGSCTHAELAAMLASAAPVSYDYESQAHRDLIARAGARIEQDGRAPMTATCSKCREPIRFGSSKWVTREGASICSVRPTPDTWQTHTPEPPPVDVRATPPSADLLDTGTVYKVWICIEQEDLDTEATEEMDAPGASVATFRSYDDAYTFAEQLTTAGEDLQ